MLEMMLVGWIGTYFVIIIIIIYFFVKYDTAFILEMGGGRVGTLLKEFL